MAESIVPIHQPLFAPRLKVMRAKHHIDELAHDTQRASTAPWPSNVLDRAAFNKRWQAGLHLSLELGDAIHNLRSALDLLACDVVRLNEKSTKGVYFPFGKDAASLDEQIIEKKFYRADPEAVKLLRELKPYAAANGALRAIHDLDVMDKHQLILPVVEEHRVSFLLKAGPTGSWPGTACCKCGASYDNDPKDRSVLVEYILKFPPGSPFASCEVIQTLHALTETVSSIIEAFAKLLLTNRENVGATPRV